MDWLVGEDFDRVLSTFERTAVRLETRDSYAVSHEADAYRDFLAGEPFDLEWHQGWLAGIRDITASGRALRRVRLLSEPPTDYQRFELAVTPTNLEAGEDIGLLPRSVSAELELPSYDYWLFDGRHLGVMHFDHAGAFQGMEMIEEPSVVTLHSEAWERARRHAVLYADYIASHPLDS
jgi:hypothetical protein